MTKKKLPTLTSSMTVTKLRRQVDEARARFDAEIETLAEQVRAEHVEPLCREFDCEFISGMGTYFFSFGDTNDAHTIGEAWGENDMESVPVKMRKRLRAVLAMLDTDVDGNQCIGYAVRDVRKERAAK